MKFMLVFVSLPVTIMAFMDPDLALSFFKKKHLDHNIILTCSNKKDQVQLWKDINRDQSKIITIIFMKNVNILHDIHTNYKRIGVLLDADCSEARELLLKCRRYKVFDSKHYWLALHGTPNYHHLFQGVNLNVDSNLQVAYPLSGSYTVDDVYNPAFDKGGELKSSNVGYYSEEEGWMVKEYGSKFATRRNFTGVRFNTVIVLPQPFEGTLDDYLKSDEIIQINTLNRFHSRLMHTCKDYYNFTMDIKVNHSWGYLQTDGTMDGLVGGLERKHVDFGLSPLFVKKERAQFISYGRPTWPLRGAFIFRNPKSRRSYQIFIKPLSLHVWMFITICGLLGIVAQKVGFSLDKMLADNIWIKSSIDSSWSYSTICTIGAFCQQGMFSCCRSYSGRTAALTTLLLGMIIYQFYNASLVSFLLNVPTTVINSLQDILDDGFGVGCEDILYFKDILKYSTENVTQEIYNLLANPTNNQSGFLPPRDGLDLVKNGKYAFHVELVTGYPIIEKEFDEPTICELKEVFVFAVKPMHANYQKFSPFKDVMDVCLQRLGEYGVIAREIIFWHPRKPMCVRSTSTININTGLQDFYPALAVLFIGMICSLQILTIELLWNCRGKVVHPFVN